MAFSHEVNDFRFHCNHTIRNGVDLDYYGIPAVACAYQHNELYSNLKLNKPEAFMFFIYGLCQFFQ